MLPYIRRRLDAGTRYFQIVTRGRSLPGTPGRQLSSSLRLVPIVLLLAAACEQRSAIAIDGSSAIDAVQGSPEGMPGQQGQQGTVARAAEIALHAPAAAEAPQQAADVMVIRTGGARIEVDSIEPAVMRVEAIATRLGGMVVSSVVETGARQHRAATLSIKVPAARFEEAVGGLTPVGRLESLHVNTTDVGEEFVDITARLASARQLEQRLLDILRTRTGKLEEVLAVERELARVRAEIERYEGRIRYLRSRVEMSVLAVSLHEPLPTLATAPGVNVIGEALKQAWRNFVALLAGAIAALGYLVPIGVVAGALVLGLRRLRRRQPVAPMSDRVVVS